MITMHSIRCARPSDLIYLPAIEREAAAQFQATPYPAMADADLASARLNLDRDYVWVLAGQLLHLSARTRYRWSLRFQVSYLTLLFRRTNRFGPVDFLPRIFAEVAAHRHKVMPLGD